MKAVSTIKELREELKSYRKEGKSVGLVPTMGYFHEGHLSLMRRARSECDVVVVSLYVNPIQFGAEEDFKEYPRDFNQDKDLVAKEGADFLFAPSDQEMYPNQQLTFVEVAKITEGLCGAHRPGHFKGVATVCAKLFNIVCPNKAYFGQKDAQQALVVKKMVEDLNFNVEMVICPTARETDGLAMSSRNTYLSPKERKQALVLYNSLKLAEDLVRGGERSSKLVKDKMQEIIGKEPKVKLEYLSVYDGRTLEEVDSLEGETLIALAARVGSTRLIDNIVLRSEGREAKGDK